ncbi:MAG: hypothetical protein MK202_04175 [Tenacibaculum sp.]|nr:hypothetical protein [Tenacibaculum sp.]
MVTQETLTINDIINEYNSKITSYPIDQLSEGLTQGKLGVLYYFLFMYIDTKKTTYLDKITDILMNVFNSLQNPDGNELLNDSSYAEGISGLGFVIDELINNDLLDDEYGEQIPVLCQIAYEYSIKMIQKDNYDFMNGSTGVLWFLLKVKNRELFNGIVEKLQEKAITAEYLFSTVSDNPYISDMNFGFPHGYLSIVKVLNDAKKVFGANEMYDQISEKCITTIMSNLNEEYTVDGIHIYKPHKLYLKEGRLTEHQNNRLAWCNSDLSLAFLLHKINKSSDYSQILQDIGDNLVKRKEMNVTGVENHHFCHGSSGIAQLFLELYHLTKDEKYLDAHQYWIARTVSYLSQDMSKELTERDMSLFYGKLGALLVLNSSLKGTNKGWKQAFLIN